MDDRDTKRLGRLGEQEAARYLKGQGCRILARNFATRLGEIDIIAEDRGTIVFVEVKCRTSDQFGEPQEAVNRKKQERIVRAAHYYLSRYAATPPPHRFDIIALTFEKNSTVKHIERIESAF